MSGRFIALDQNVSVRLMSAALTISVEELAGIETALHSVNEIGYSGQGTDDWSFILVDTRNAFNERNTYTMLWTVRYP